MPTNFFFRNEDFQPEQNLLNDLTVEMIKIHGIDIYYLIRKTGEIDNLYEEAPASSFNVAVPMEVYVNSYEGFQGEGDLLTKFGLSIADKLTISVARIRFAEDIGAPYSLIRPREGDLIYFPFTKGIFEIKFVEHEAAFYQRGALQYFELQCEKFNYNSETFNTGIPDIDAIEQNYSTGDDNFFFLTENGFNINTEDNYDLVNESFGLLDPIDQNDEFQIRSDMFTDFTIQDPFSEMGRY